MSEKRNWNALEPWGFFLLILLSLFPLFLHPFLISLDGPMHLYNSRIIADLWSGGEWSGNYFSFNEYLIPNWTAHLILAALIPFVGPVWAMKLHHIILLVSMSYAFRGIVRTVNPKYPALSVLILPFFWSWFILLGFYNFLWGSVMAMVLFRINILYSGKSVILFFMGLAVGVLLYFSHPTWLVISAVGIVFWAIVNLGKDRRVVFSSFACLTGMLPAFYGLLRFMNRSSLSWESESYLGIKELGSLIYKVFPLVMYPWAKEGPWLRMILLGGALVFVSLLLFRKQEDKIRYRFINWSLLFSVALLVLFFILPDSTSSGSYVSTRMLYSVLMVLFLSMAATARKSGWSLLALTLVLTGHFALVNLYNSFYSRHDDRIDQLREWGLGIPAFSTVAIKNESTWIFDHVESFTALKNPLILHINSEALTGYFPIVVDPRSDEERKAFSEPADFLIWITESEAGATVDGYSLKAFSDGMYLLERDEPGEPAF
jgi:hypothetical protein